MDANFLLVVQDESPNIGAVASVAVVEEFASPDTPLVPAEEVASVELVAVVVEVFAFPDILVLVAESLVAEPHIEPVDDHIVKGYSHISLP